MRSHIHAEMIEKGKMRLQERVKAEMHQSVVEVGTGICHTVKEAVTTAHMARELFATPWLKRRARLGVSLLTPEA